MLRDGLEGPCDNLIVDELTEEDLELCEVFCQKANVTECAKVMNGTDEDGNEIWEDEPGKQFNRKNFGLCFGLKNGLRLRFDSETCLNYPFLNIF